MVSHKVPEGFMERVRGRAVGGSKLSSSFFTKQSLPKGRPRKNLHRLSDRLSKSYKYQRRPVVSPALRKLGKPGRAMPRLDLSGLPGKAG